MSLKRLQKVKTALSLGFPTIFLAGSAAGRCEKTDAPRPHVPSTLPRPHVFCAPPLRPHVPWLRPMLFCGPAGAPTLLLDRPTPLSCRTMLGAPASRSGVAPGALPDASPGMADELSCGRGVGT